MIKIPDEYAAEAVKQSLDKGFQLNVEIDETGPTVRVIAVFTLGLHDEFGEPDFLDFGKPA